MSRISPDALIRPFENTATIVSALYSLTHMAIIKSFWFHLTPRARVSTFMCTEPFIVCMAIVLPHTHEGTKACFGLNRHE